MKLASIAGRRSGAASTLATLVAICLIVAGCAAGQVKRELAGGATVSNEQMLEASSGPPRAIYVIDFPADPGAFKPASGVVSNVLDERPHLIGGGRGVLGGRIGGPETPDPNQLVDTLATAITQGLNDQQLGFPAQRLPAASATPTSGWLVRGQIISIDPGDRALRAVVGFGAGEATAEVTVEVDRLGPDRQTPVLRFGTNADSGKAPGAAVTMNPYVAAAKFVIGKKATHRDVEAMGKEIAKQIGDYARSKGVGTSGPT
jgi:hypothetical protein